MANGDQEPIPYSTGDPSPPPPPPAPPADTPPVRPRQDNPLAGIDLDRIYGNQQKLIGEEIKAREQDRANRPPLPKQEKIPPAPTNDIRGEAMTWLGFASAIGGLAGLASRGNSIAALNAFSGTLDGLQQGNQQKFEQNYKIWEANARALEQNNRTEMDGYKSILERQDLDQRQRGELLELHARMNRNEFMLKVAQAYKDDPTIMAAALDSISSFSDKGNDSFLKIIETRQQIQLRNEEEMRRLEYQRGTALMSAQARAEARQPRESDESLMGIVQRKWQGDPTAGRYLTGENRTRFDELFNQFMQEGGRTPEDLVRNQQQYAGGMSGARSVGTRIANLETIQRSALAVAPAALNASKQVSRVPILGLAEAQQWVQTQTGDPKLKAFVGYNLQLAEQAARSQKPGGVLDVTLQRQFFDYLNTAQNQRSYQAAVETIVRGIGRELNAAKAQERGDPVVSADEMLKGTTAPRPLGGGITGGGKAAPAPTTDYSKMSDDELRRQLGIQ